MGDNLFARPRKIPHRGSARGRGRSGGEGLERALVVGLGEESSGLAVMEGQEAAPAVACGRG